MSVNEITIQVPLQPKQKELYELVENSSALWIGYGGSRGGSKSHAARAIMLLRRLSYSGTRGVIFRRTYEKVRENHIEPLFRQYPFMRAWFNQQNKELKLPNGSAVLFRYAENPGDVDEFIGQEYMDFVVDQAEMLTEKELNTLKSCTRWTGLPDSKCKFITTFNPGNVGHKFLKRIYWDKEYRELERPGDYAFLQAFGWDNIEWSRQALAEASISDKQYYSWPDEDRFAFFITQSQYGRELNALPEALRIGWLLGKMDQFAGQYFDCFDPRRHVRHRAAIKLEAWWPRWVSIDWGYAHPAAVYWHAKDGDRVITYRELHGAGIGEKELGAKIGELSNSDLDASGHPIKIQSVFLSPDAYAERTSAHTLAQEISDGLLRSGLPSAQMADNDRIGGARLCYQMLAADLITISSDCKELVECLPTLIHEEGNEEDLLKVDGDDSYDAWRYGLKSYLSPGRKPLALRVDENMASVQLKRIDLGLKPVTDPTALALMTRLAVSKEKKAFKPVPLITRGKYQRPHF